MAAAFSSLALTGRVFWNGGNERQHADVSPDFLYAAPVCVPSLAFLLLLSVSTAGAQRAPSPGRGATSVQDLARLGAPSASGVIAVPGQRKCSDHDSVST